MKYILLVSLLSLFKTPVLLASCADSSYIKGYLIIQYNKNEIIQQKKDSILKSQGQPYTSAIDLEKEEVFIPSECMSESLIKSFLEYKVFHQKTVYCIPNSPASLLYAKKLCNREVDENLTVNYFKGNSQYYSINHENSDKLYKIYYLEGFAVTLDIENNSKNQIALDLSSDQVTKEKTFKIVLPYKLITVVNNFVHLDGFSLWSN